MATTRRDVLRIGWGGVLASSFAGQAGAQDDYPNKPIKVIVAAAPGGPTDVPARIASQILAPKFGQPVVVENRPGAGGALGARVVATSPPDGYTLLAGNTSTLAAIPAVSESAGYDPVKDFAPIIRINEGFQILVVHPDSPWRTVKEFVEAAKANPGKINYGHTGPGGLPHLAGEIVSVAERRQADGGVVSQRRRISTAVLSKAIDATFENIAILRGLISGGQAPRAWRAEQEPHAAPAGHADDGGGRRAGLRSQHLLRACGSAGTPPNIIKKISDAMNEGLATAEMQKSITALGSEAKPNSPTEFADYIAVQHKKWVEVGKAAGVKVN